MKIIVAMVESADGKITYGDSPNIHRWTSKEDQQHFEQLKNKAKLIVMGSKTYEAAKKMMELSDGRLRVVLTRDPKKYEDQTIPSQLEFTDESPQDLTARLEKEGHTEMLLAGGGEINGLFIDAGLVDELLLTLEPKLLGSGKSMTVHKNITAMKLLSVEKMNEQGTLLLRYKIEK